MLDVALNKLNCQHWCAVKLPCNYSNCSILESIVLSHATIV